MPLPFSHNCASKNGAEGDPNIRSTYLFLTLPFPSVHEIFKANFPRPIHGTRDTHEYKQKTHQASKCGMFELLGILMTQEQRPAQSLVYLNIRWGSPGSC